MRASFDDVLKVGAPLAARLSVGAWPPTSGRVNRSYCVCPTYAVAESVTLMAIGSARLAVAGETVGLAVAEAMALTANCEILTKPGRIVGTWFCTVTRTPRALTGNGPAPKLPTLGSCAPVTSRYTADVEFEPLLVANVWTIDRTWLSERLSLSSSRNTCHAPPRLAASAAVCKVRR